MNKFIFYASLFVLGSTLLLSSCKKEEFTTDASAKLDLSADTILFDTVFTTVGSSTENFIIYNNNDKAITISSIRIATGNNSNFRLNVNGIPGRTFSNVEIDANDSIWVFVEVTVDPNNQNTPLVITDSILFETNGNLQEIDLVAWGQNAVFHRPEPNAGSLFFVDTLNVNVVWDNTLPHVIYGYAIVDSGQTLTINAGTNIHFHPGSGLIVMSSGSLLVNGTFTDPVNFQGDRLGVNYSEAPGQWDYIRLSNITRRNLQGDFTDIGPGVLNCRMDWTVIKNGNVGLVADTSFNSSSTTLTMNNCIVKNMSGAGLLGRGSVIKAKNCVFANCGQYLAQLIYGGNYEFLHCTFANYWQNGNRQTSSVFLNNYYVDVRPLNSYFGNCIVYGNLDSEIEYDSASVPQGAFNFLFDHCLLKLDNSVSISNPNNYSNVIRNYDPLFTDTEENDYTLDSTSIAIDAGDFSIVNLSPVLNFDLKNNSRPQGLNPDLGAYERR